MRATPPEVGLRGAALLTATRMSTLGNWVDKCSTTPSTIECQHMALQGFEDRGGPLYEGSGRIELRSTSDTRFVMHAIPRDKVEGFKRLAAA
jgi:hypothetical protein